MLNNVFTKKAMVIFFALITSFCVTASDTGENIVDDHQANGTDTLDDKATIMAAINAACAPGGSHVVIIPKGTFYLDSTIDLKDHKYDGLTVKGIGIESIIIHRGGDYAFKLGDGTSNGAVNHMTFKDFKIKCDPANTNASAGIYVYRSQRNLFCNLHIRDYTSQNSGLSQEGGAAMKFKFSWIHTVRECTFVHLNNAIYLYSGGNTANALNIVDCIIENIQKYGIYLRDAAGVNISGCCIEGGNMEYGIYAHSGKGYKISGCYFEWISKACIYLYSSAYLGGVSITGNYMNLDISECAINIYGVQGAKISGNSFRGAPSEAIVKTRCLGYVRQVWLTGNQHNVDDGTPLWNGYDYLKKYNSTHKIESGMWEDVQNNKLIYGSSYTLFQDQ